MKKLIIIIVILSLITIIGLAKLSDETLKTVDGLRWKHYGCGTIDITDVSEWISIGTCGTASTIDSNFDYKWWNFYFEDGKLFVETQDGKWFIEMEKIEERKEE